MNNWMGWDPYKVKPSVNVLISSLRIFQYTSTYSPSTNWTDKALIILHSYLLQRDNWKHWIPRTIAVAHTLMTPYPQIHSSHDTSIHRFYFTICITTRVFYQYSFIFLLTRSLFLWYVSTPVLSPSSCTSETSPSHIALKSIARLRHTSLKYPVLKIHHPIVPQQRLFTPRKLPPIIAYIYTLTSSYPLTSQPPTR